MEGVLSRPETLQQHLLWQLQLEPMDEELRAIAVVLVQNLDDDGFHKEAPETLFSNNDTTFMTPPTQSKLADAMRFVQMLEPIGCCTANYLESLRVQISLLRETPACLDCSLDHLELFERGKFSEAAKIMKCDPDEAQACFNMLKKLSPFPGRRYTAAEVRFVIPDIRVFGNNGDFSIVINNEVIPALGIDPFFKKLNSGRRRDQNSDTASRPARDFARENVREAKNFINSIAMRKHTLKRVAQAIVEFQKPFFANGPQHIVPLTLSDIAGELGIHETTVSRAAHDKYMQTDWGIFELRNFFTNSISGTGSSGSRFSKEGVKAIIKEMITSEHESLSDHKITELLEQRGISLARRTVAKYRKELDLGSSYTR
jgi:RNA polymerase sigma-54 factor